jgi:hypothetical protein
MDLPGIAMMALAACILASCEGNEPRKEVAATAKSGTSLEILGPDTTGITFRNTIVEDDQANYFRYLYMYNGGGVAAGDIDGDGLADLAFVSYRSGGALYKNLGGMKFQDISASAGFTVDDIWATGVSMADVNADGRLDIYVCASGLAGWAPSTRRNKLFINLGDGKFKEDAAKAGLADEGHNTMAYFADLDRDEDLDCFIASHRSDFRPLGQELAMPKAAYDPATSNKLYINDGTGHFTDHTVEAGSASHHYGLGAAIGDLNNDGLVDIYVTNDFYTPDLMMVNDGTRGPGEVPHFKDIAQQALKHTSYFSMGVDRADYDNDGNPDLCVLDMTPGDHKLNKENMASMAPGQFDAMVANGMHHQYMINTLQRNNGDRTWSEVAQMAGVDRTDWSWAPLFVDLDNDGWKDLFVTNGITRDVGNNDFRDQVRKFSGASSKQVAFEPLLELAPTHVPEKMVFRNQHDLTFTKAMDEWGYHQKTLSNGGTYADLDLDGDMDLVTVDVNAPATVVRNLTRENGGGGYLQLVLKGEGKNPFSIGASATLYSASGKQVCDLFPARGYLGSVEPVLHFGVPDEHIDSVVITWPDGKQTLLHAPARDQRIMVDRSSLRERPRAVGDVPLFREVAAAVGLGLGHRENAFDDFATESLLPQRQSMHGPAAAAADVDGDGLDDVFLTASAGSPCLLLLQNRSGQFAPARAQPWAMFRSSEFNGAHFFDADGDRDVDLYLAAGSTEFPSGDERYRDRLFINDGHGVLAYAERALPDTRVSTLAVASDDIDGDGDLDLFIGGRNVPGRWPSAPVSQVLLNDHGIFTDASPTWLAALPRPGLVTEALFTDVDGDRRAELVLCGEWMPVRVLKSAGGTFKDISAAVLDTSLIGWWQGMTAGDIDGDGDADLVVGNIGLNNKFHPSVERPLRVYMGDLDGSGTNDIVLAKTGDQCELPVRGRECSSRQMPFIQGRFPTYKDFANATLEGIYGEALRNALRLRTTTFASMVFINTNGRFAASPLPMAAQVSAARSILMLDADVDGKMDLLLAGNLYGTEAETPRYDAGTGLLLQGDGKGGFMPMSAMRSGISIPFDTRHVLPITIAGRGRGLLAVNNSGPILVFVPGH